MQSVGINKHILMQNQIMDAICVLLLLITAVHAATLDDALDELRIDDLELGGHLTKMDICSLPEEVGVCRSSIPRYFFNTATRKCEEFIYGGCRGNQNNFKTEKECLETCSHKMDIENVLDDFNIDSLELEGNLVIKDICNYPVEVGYCRALFGRYFFNTGTRKCEEFTYGGCGGNQNNFHTEEECLEACSHKMDNGSTDNEDICFLDPDYGGCSNYTQMYFYNRFTGQCHEFIFGGCLGNKNKFDTKEECETFCQGMAVDKKPECHKKGERGPCDGLILRCYYDPSDRSCKTFRYGGCRGNANNFKDVEECMDVCD